MSSQFANNRTDKICIGGMDKYQIGLQYHYQSESRDPYTGRVTYTDNVNIRSDAQYNDIGKPFDDNPHFYYNFQNAIFTQSEVQKVLADMLYPVRNRIDYKSTMYIVGKVFQTTELSITQSECKNVEGKVITMEYPAQIRDYISLMRDHERTFTHNSTQSYSINVNLGCSKFVMPSLFEKLPTNILIIDKCNQNIWLNVTEYQLSILDYFVDFRACPFKQIHEFWYMYINLGWLLYNIDTIADRNRLLFTGYRAYNSSIRDYVDNCPILSCFAKIISKDPPSCVNHLDAATPNYDHKQWFDDNIPIIANDLGVSIKREYNMKPYNSIKTCIRKQQPRDEEINVPKTLNDLDISIKIKPDPKSRLLKVTTKSSHIRNRKLQLIEELKSLEEIEELDSRDD